jgi:hypothetical protein
MEPLIETNPHLRDPEVRRRLIEEDAYESSVFEGAQGLPEPVSRPAEPLRRVNASSKKPARSS